MRSGPDASTTRREEILEAAGRVFVREGLDAARMEDIAREAGLSVGGVYWHYAHKDDLIGAFTEALLDEELRAWRALLSAPGSVRERLQSLMGSRPGRALERQAILHELLGRAARDGRVQARLARHFAAHLDILMRLIRQGIRQGEFRPDDPRPAATALAALYRGALVLEAVDPAIQAADDALWGAVSAFLAGLGPRGARS